MVTKALASYLFCRFSEVIAGILEDHRVFKYWDCITSEEPSQIYISLIHHSMRHKFSNSEPASLSQNHGPTTSIFIHSTVTFPTPKHSMQRTHSLKKITNKDSKSHQIMKIYCAWDVLQFPGSDGCIFWDLCSKPSSHIKIICYEALRIWINAPLQPWGCSLSDWGWVRVAEYFCRTMNCRFL